MNTQLNARMVLRARWAAMAVALAASALGVSASPAQASIGYELVAQWGGYGSGDGQFWAPRGVAVDAAGHVYVADTPNNRIEKFDSNGVFLGKWGTLGMGDGQFWFPFGVTVDGAGNVYVADTENGRIQKFDSNGAFLAKWGGYGSGDGQFASPWNVAVDGAGNVYVADTYNHRVQKFDSSGTFLAKWGSYGSGDGQFLYLSDVAVDGAGNVYTVDRQNHRIQKFDSDGAFLGKWGSSGSSDGELSFPWGITVDGHGNVYVGDAMNSRIQKFDAAGAFLAGWSTMGPGDAEHGATDVAVDSGGYVYVADVVNNRIEKFAPVATDTTAPTIDITTPADGGHYVLGRSVQADYACADEAGGSGLKSCTGDLADGATLDTSAVGEKSFTVTAQDNAGNAATTTVHYRVVYDFAGFFSPVENVDANGHYVLNKVRAGSAVPIKFGLGGDQGLAILASGYPKSEVIACDPSAEVEAIDQTVSAGGSSLSYDPASRQYSYVWKTDKTWRGCRQLVVTLADGTTHRASFSFGS